MSDFWKAKYQFIVRRLIPKALQLIGAVVVFCCILVLVLILNHDFFFDRLEDFLIAEQAPSYADVIIVLSGDEQAKRVAYGAGLFKQGYANKMLMAGGASWAWSATCAEVMKKQAVHLGVPQDSILLEEKSATTYENAKYSLEVMQTRGYKSAILVTSHYHTRRAKIIFNSLFLDKGISLTVCPIPYKTRTQKWWEDDVGVRSVATEYMKLIWHYLFQTN